MMDTENQTISKTNEALVSAQSKASTGDYSGARTVLEDEIKRIETDSEYNDERFEYHTFAEPIEHILFMNNFTPEKEVRAAGDPVASLYLTYGNLLLGMSEFDGAKEALQKAIKWNPVNPNLRLEYADIFRAEENMEEFFNATLDAFKTAYTRKFFGRCYRNLGYYFIEKEKWNEAMACYVMSLHYDSKSEDAPKEMEYIQEKSDGTAVAPTMEEFEALAKDYGFPSGPDEKIVGIAAFYGHQALDDGRKDVARYFLNICYDLTADATIKEKLDDITD